MLERITEAGEDGCVYGRWRYPLLGTKAHEPGEPKSKPTIGQGRLQRFPGDCHRLTRTAWHRLHPGLHERCQRQAADIVPPPSAKSSGRARYGPESFSKGTWFRRDGTRIGVQNAADGANRRKHLSPPTRSQVPVGIDPGDHLGEIFAGAGAMRRCARFVGMFVVHRELL